MIQVNTSGLTDEHKNLYLFKYFFKDGGVFSLSRIGLCAVLRITRQYCCSSGNWKLLCTFGLVGLILKSKVINELS